MVVRRGCYVERTRWEHADEDTRYQLAVRAAVLVQTRSAVVSHGSAAVLLGLPIRPRWREVVHVTRPGVTGSRTEGGVKHHRAGYAERDLAVVDGLVTTGLARTASTSVGSTGSSTASSPATRHCGWGRRRPSSSGRSRR